MQYASDGNTNPALGAGGGLPGAPARQYKRTATGETVELYSEGVSLGPAETVPSFSCGGGGYGSPLERESERVRHDVVEGWVTRERAEQAYGVVLTPAGAVNFEATEDLRHKLRRRAR